MGNMSGRSYCKEDGMFSVTEGGVEMCLVMGGETKTGADG